MGIQEYRDTGYRNKGKQEYSDTVIQGYKNTGIQEYRDTEIQGY